MSLFRFTLLSSALVCLLTLTRTSQAQASVFATLTGTSYGFQPADSNTISYKDESAGFTGGASYNFHRDSKLILGMDARASYSPGAKGGTHEILAFQLGLVPDRVRLRPYFDTGFGVISSVSSQDNYIYSSYGYGYTYSTYVTQKRYTDFAYELAFGLDVKLTNSFDWRAIEFAGIAGIGNGELSNAGTVSTGLVYHFKPLGRTQ